MPTINSINIGTGTSGQVLTSNGTGVTPTFQAAAGNVAGPGSSTDRAIATWNGTTGTALFNNSSVKIDSTGRQTNTTQPVFYAYLSGNVANATGDNTTYTVAYDSTFFNVGSSFNTSTAQFTAPVTGTYLFVGSFQLFSLGAAHTSFLGDLVVNGSGIRLFRSNPGAMRDSSNQLGLSGSLIITMTAATVATMIVTVAGSTKTVGVVGTIAVGSTFQGYLLC